MQPDPSYDPVPDLAALLRVLHWARPIGPAYPGSAADLHDRAAYAEWVIGGERYLPGCVEGTDMDGSGGAGAQRGLRQRRDVARQLR